LHDPAGNYRTGNAQAGAHYESAKNLMDRLNQAMIIREFRTGHFCAILHRDVNQGDGAWRWGPGPGNNYRVVLLLC